MGLESATYISDFTTTNPVSTDAISQGDDHIRLLKSVLKTTFPNADHAIYTEAARADLASASSPDLWAVASNYVNITGTTTITDFADAPASGRTKLVRFDGALTLTYGASTIDLPGGADITTVAGDHALFVSQGTTLHRCIAYMRADGKALYDNIPDQASNGGKFLTTDGSALSWGVPVTPGLVMCWPTAAAPTGWLECNGADVSRTTYANLFAVIAETYGNGDGSTTFTLPDMRGYFVRGWAHGTSNDPDKASRTDRGDGTTGDNVGTKQGDQYESHSHGFDSASYAQDGSGPSGGTSHLMADGGSPVTANPANTTGSSGGNETRPLNINMMFIIKT